MAIKKVRELFVLRALLRGLVQDGRLETSLARARALAAFSEKIVTRAKKDGLAARRQVAALLGEDRKTVTDLFAKVLPKLTKRQSGFTRIVKLGTRRGDASPRARVEWVGEKAKVEEKDVNPKNIPAKSK